MLECTISIVAIHTLLVLFRAKFKLEIGVRIHIWLYNHFPDTETSSHYWSLMYITTSFSDSEISSHYRYLMYITTSFRYCKTQSNFSRCRSSWPKVFLKISKNSQESTCVRASFLIKLQGETCNFIKK